MNAEEIQRVAQAITDAHAHKPGLDCSGHTDSAKTIIAAFDAIQSFRSRPEPKAAKVAAQPQPEPVIEAAVDVPDGIPAPDLAPAKPKAKGKKA